MNNPFDILPPLYFERSPVLSLVLGFIFGPLGIGLYWLSILDFIILVIPSLVLNAYFSNSGLFAANIFISIYGYYRAANSNKRLQ